MAMRKRPAPEMEKEPTTPGGMKRDMKQDAMAMKQMSKAKRPPPRRGKSVPPGMMGGM